MKKIITCFVCLAALIFATAIQGQNKLKSKKESALEFDQAWAFSEGLARVSLGNKLGYIDKSGKVVIEPQFDLAFDFSDGMAFVINDGKFSYIDKTGKMPFSLEIPDFTAIDPDRTYDFSEGLAPIKIDGKFWIYG